MKKIEWSLDLLQKLPKSKDDALAQGSKYYFDGAFCKESHISPRIVKNGRCFICKREETKKLATIRRRNSGVVSNKLEIIKGGLNSQKIKFVLATHLKLQLKYFLNFS